MAQNRSLAERRAGFGYREDSSNPPSADIVDVHRRTFEWCGGGFLSSRKAAASQWNT